jgi:hypothetical protein
MPEKWRSQGGGGDGGATAPPNRHKNHSLKKAKSVEKLVGVVHVACSKLKLIKHVSDSQVRKKTIYWRNLICKIRVEMSGKIYVFDVLYNLWNSARFHPQNA